VESVYYVVNKHKEIFDCSNSLDVSDRDVIKTTVCDPLTRMSNLAYHDTAADYNRDQKL